ncbi:MAG TPA: bifunctional nuclease domain-containing protein [Phycisphaerae bacterium]|nr:bifunctional nuclease domain-containing protein [Phycisphaerae bacterium]
MDVPMELSRILITEFGDQQVIFLKEKNGQRSFPILIGTMEALAIDRRLKGIETPRPMTHELLARVIDAMGGRIDRIVINDLREHTFIATLYIRRGTETIRVDSRPSDAIALGVAFETPIFVAEHVLDSVLNEGGTAEERIELLRKRMEMLHHGITELNRRLNDEDFLHQAPEPVIAQVRRQLDEMRNEYEAIDRVLKKLG